MGLFVFLIKDQYETNVTAKKVCILPFKPSLIGWLLASAIVEVAAEKKIELREVSGLLIQFREIPACRSLESIH